MATQAEIQTLQDWAALYNRDGTFPDIVQYLSQTNEVLNDMMWMEANDGTFNKTVIQTSKPTGTWRQINAGAAGGKATHAAVQDRTGMLEMYPWVDKKLVRMSSNPERYRMNNTLAAFSGLSDQMASTLFYNSELVNPYQFHGLSPRTPFGTIAGGQVVDAGGTGSDNTSVWCIAWSEQTAYGIFPKGSQAGLQHIAMPDGQVERDALSRVFEVWRDHIIWEAGLTVRDPRAIVRVANIDVSQLTSDITYLKSIIGFLIQASEKMYYPGNVSPTTGTAPDPQRPRVAWYGNRVVRSALRNAILEKIGLNLTWETVAGQRVMMFDNAPFRQTDAIINAEARVV